MKQQLLMKAALSGALKQIGNASAIHVRQLPGGKLQVIDGHLRTELLGKKKQEEPRGLELQQAEIDLAYYEGQVKSAKLVDNRGLEADDIRFGAVIKVRNQAGAEREYSIVGEDEADAAAGRLNWASPLAAALLGKKQGVRVRLERKGGDIDLEILSVGYPGK